MTVAADSAPRTRPRDRKRRIEEAAALAFARDGYHAVGMQDIASAVGISAPALYRHFPNKYALFARTAFVLVHRLVEATDAAAAMPLDSPGDAAAALDDFVNAVIATTIELRAVGGIYRWEGRYLEPGDRELLRAEFQSLRRRIEAIHGVYRPEVSPEDRAELTMAALSTIASTTAHRTVVAARTLTTLLRDASWRALDGVLPHGVPAVERVIVRPSATDQGRRAQLVDSAIRLFAERGYNEVTIDELASTVDLTASGVYRHFEGKSALLLAACDRAAIELDRAVLHAKESSTTSAEALRGLVRAYIVHTFDNVALTRVYFSEVRNLAPDEQRRLRAMQRAHIADWSALLQAVRPDLGGREAVVLVHAALGVVNDQVMVLEERDDRAAARLAHLVEVVLGVA